MILAQLRMLLKQGNVILVVFLPSLIGWLGPQPLWNMIDLLWFGTSNHGSLVLFKNFRDRLFVEKV